MLETLPSRSTVNSKSTWPRKPKESRLRHDPVAVDLVLPLVDPGGEVGALRIEGQTTHLSLRRSRRQTVRSRLVHPADDVLRGGENARGAAPLPCGIRPAPAEGRRSLREGARNPGALGVSTLSPALATASDDGVIGAGGGGVA